MAKTAIQDPVLFPPVRVPRDVAEQVDQLAQANQLTRSWVVRKALADYVSALRPVEIR